MRDPNLGHASGIEVFIKRSFRDRALTTYCLLSGGSLFIMLGMIGNGISSQNPIYVFLEDLQTVLLIIGVTGFSMWAAPHVFVYCLSKYFEYVGEKKRKENALIREKERAAEALAREQYDAEIEKQKQRRAIADEEDRARLEKEAKARVLKRAEEKRRRSSDDANKSALDDF